MTRLPSLLPGLVTVYENESDMPPALLALAIEAEKRERSERRAELKAQRARCGFQTRKAERAAARAARKARATKG